MYPNWASGGCHWDPVNARVTYPVHQERYHRRSQKKRWSIWDIQKNAVYNFDLFGWPKDGSNYLIDNTYNRYIQCMCIYIYTVYIYIYSICIYIYIYVCVCIIIVSSNHLLLYMWYCQLCINIIAGTRAPVLRGVECWTHWLWIWLTVGRTPGVKAGFRAALLPGVGILYIYIYSRCVCVWDIHMSYIQYMKIYENI